MNASDQSFSLKQWSQILRRWRQRLTLPAKRAAYPHSEPSSRKQILFETLEQRLLLSADLNPAVDLALRERSLPSTDPIVIVSDFNPSAAPIVQLKSRLESTPPPDAAVVKAAVIAALKRGLPDTSTDWENAPIQIGRNPPVDRWKITDINSGARNGERFDSGSVPLGEADRNDTSSLAELIAVIRHFDDSVLHSEGFLDTVDTNRLMQVAAGINREELPRLKWEASTETGFCNALDTSQLMQALTGTNREELPRLKWEASTETGFRDALDTNRLMTSNLPANRSALHINLAGRLQACIHRQQPSLADWLSDWLTGTRITPSNRPLYQSF